MRIWDFFVVGLALLVLGSCCDMVMAAGETTTTKKVETTVNKVEITTVKAATVIAAATTPKLILAVTTSAGVGTTATAQEVSTKVFELASTTQKASASTTEAPTTARAAITTKAAGTTASASENKAAGTTFVAGMSTTAVGTTRTVTTAAVTTNVVGTTMPVKNLSIMVTTSANAIKNSTFDNSTSQPKNAGTTGLASTTAVTTKTAGMTRLAPNAAVTTKAAGTTMVLTTSANTIINSSLENSTATSNPSQNATRPINRLASTKTALGKACSKIHLCGENTKCEYFTGCSMGFCTCQDGYKRLEDNPYDCFKMLAIDDACSVTDRTQSLLMPDGAACDAKTRKVSCIYPTESGPCRGANPIGNIYQKLFDVCDDRDKRCNAQLGHACVANGTQRRCDCASNKRKSSLQNSELCVEVKYGEYCDNDAQCMAAYKGKSTPAASSCNATTNTCACSDGFRPARFMVVGETTITTICVPKNSLISRPDRLCSVGAAIANNRGFCRDASFCRRCPEHAEAPGDENVAFCIVDGINLDKSANTAVVISGSLFGVIWTLSLLSLLN